MSSAGDAAVDAPRPIVEVVRRIVSKKWEGDGWRGTECAATERDGGGEDNESGARAYLVTVPSARSGPTIAKSRDDKGKEKMGGRGRPHIAGGGGLSTA